ncbi:MAG: hypothetical protein K2O29_05960 [Ruminococcus sp.]|nr:hypothetical protein [Ruminococcus sp.]MDE7137986.1 hypothetical protein [Ruminococcus sp.]
MKKSKIIIISVFTVVFVLVLIFLVFFPALPLYFQMKRECPTINRTVEEFDFTGDISEDFKEITSCGIILKVPSDMYRKNPDSSVEIYVCGKEKNYNTVVMFYESSDVSEYNASELSYDELKSFCSYINEDVPQSLYEFQKLNLSLNTDDFNMRDKELAETFLRLAVSKEFLVGQDKCSHVYSFENNCAEGFIYEYETPKNYTEYMIEIYREGKYSTEYSVLIRAENPETAKQIIESIEITEE